MSLGKMTDHAHFTRLAKLERLAHTMDMAFRVPGTKFRIGWDAIMGIVPVVGDALAVAPSAFILLESHRMGLPRRRLVQQGINCGIDFAIGSIPLIGVLFDASYKANRKNVAILREHIEGQMQTAPAVGEGRLSSHHPTLGDPGGS